MNARTLLGVAAFVFACSTAPSDDGEATGGGQVGSDDAGASGAAAGGSGFVGGGDQPPVGGAAPNGGTQVTGGAAAPGGSPAPGGNADTGGTPSRDEWPDETDTPWTPAPPASLHDNLPEVPGERPADCRAEWITSVRGYILAPGGAPQVGAKGQVCVFVSPGGQRICLRPGDADAQGVFTVPIPDNARCISRIAMRVLQPAVGKATMYCPVDIAGTGPNLVMEAPHVVFQTRRANDLPPEGEDTMTREINLDDGLIIDFTPELFYSGGAGYEDLAARRVDPDAPGLCFLAGEPRPDGLYALYPEGTVDAPGFPIHIPNASSLPGGTAVELLALGGLDCQQQDGRHIEEAVFEPFGTGTVSADGTTIDSDPGVGLPCLTWLGYRRLP